MATPPSAPPPPYSRRIRRVSLNTAVPEHTNEAPVPRLDSPNPFSLAAAQDPTPPVVQPLGTLQQQLRNQIRSVLGLGQPSETPSTLASLANRFRNTPPPTPANVSSSGSPLARALTLPVNGEANGPSENDQASGANGHRTPLLHALDLNSQDVRATDTEGPPGTKLKTHTAANDNPESFTGALCLPQDTQLLGSPTATTREDFMFLADIAYRAHRHEELLAHVRTFLSLKGVKRELAKEERYFIAVAYKDSVRAIRDSWRKIRRLDQDDGKLSRDKITQYRTELENMMRSLCQEGLKISLCLLNDPSSTTESRMFFFKVQGDLYRYIAEYATGTERTDAAKQGRAAYEEADKMKSCVTSVHPLRLGLALNFGVFLRDACMDSNRGWRVTKVALDEANRGFSLLGELDAYDYKESNGLLQNLRRNLMRWNSGAEIDTDQHQTRSPNRRQANVLRP